LKKKVSLSVGEFALPVPRVGSIETHSGYGSGSAEGSEIHLRVQEQRRSEHSDYESEVPISAQFERGDYVFHIAGRLDGIFRKQPPVIEEIKSCFNIRDLERKLSDESEVHPYCLQLKTYGYFSYLEHKIEPKLRFLIVSTRTGKSEELRIPWNVDSYESWLEKRLDELLLEVRRSEARALRRQRSAKKFVFPFENPRPGQLDLMARIEDAMSNRTRMLIQAPTGLGKTAGVLFPVLREALTRGQSAIYVTPKNSQHSVAEDAVQRLQDCGAKIKSLTLTAKSKICMKNEPLCNPEYCEFAKDHYTKVHENGLSELLFKKRKLTTRTFQKLAEEFKVCPFELQFDAAKEAEVVIGDYNYVFSPRSSIGRLTANGVGQEGRPNLVIDEAHNLYSRAQGYFSPEVSTFMLERMREDVEHIPSRFQGEAERLLDECKATILACEPEASKEKASKQTNLIEPPVELFLEQEAELKAFLSRYLESDVEIQPRDVVLRMCFYWSEFTAALDFVGIPKRPEFFTTFRPLTNGGAVRITCCDASEMIQDCYDEYEQVVGFSATLKPFDYYAKLSGLKPEEIAVAEFRSPFPKDRRKLLIIPEISTKYSTREKNYPKVAEVIRRIAALRSGNYFAFFPSFEFLQRVHELFVPPEGFLVIRQHRDMKSAEIEAIVNHLKERGTPTIVFAVQGGVFSEGVDYPGDMIIGAFVVGPALPSFDLEREKMRSFYDDKYGSGFDYAYSYPAMAKVVQAAGRVVRSETDRGLIVLMDTRFIQPGYSRSMPTDWFDKHPNELVSRSILKEVADFWATPT
jgi:DNA excision repair protein ERCC-2